MNAGLPGHAEVPFEDGFAHQPAADSGIMNAVPDAAINVTAPDGNEFIVEIWKPSWSEGMDIWDSLAYALWSLVSPGWRINVKRFPVRGRKAIYRERAGSRAEAQQTAEAIAESLSRTGNVS